MPSCNNSSNHTHNDNEDIYCPVNPSAKVVIYKDIEYNGITLSVGVCCPNAGHELIISNEIKKNNGEFKIEERNNEYILQKKNGNNYVDIQNLKLKEDMNLNLIKWGWMDYYLTMPPFDLNFRSSPAYAKVENIIFDNSKNCKYNLQGEFKCNKIEK